MIVTVFGSTEEGALDPIDEILELRDSMEKKENPKSFLIHADAAWGGYLPSIIPSDVIKQYNYIKIKEDKDEYQFKNEEDKKEAIKILNKMILKLIKDLKLKIQSSYTEKNITFENVDKEFIKKFNKKFYDKILALMEVDSITIDPHKMGYVPYPGGCILFKDQRIKDYISYNAPYLPSDEKDISRLFVGQWTIEGSRPGAPAISCYLSSKVVPLDPSGYGELIKRSVISTALFWHALHVFNNDPNNIDYEIVPLFTPDFNIVNYVFTNKKLIKTFDELHLLQYKIYNRMTIKIKENKVQNYNYIISNSDLKYKNYEKQVDNLLKNCGIVLTDSDKLILKEHEKEIKIFRSVIMNPFLVEKKIAFFLDFWNEMKKNANELIPEVIFSNCDKKLNVLWLEDDSKLKNKSKQIDFNEKYGKYFGKLDFVSDCESAEHLVSNKDFEIAIVDINLSDTHSNEAVLYTEGLYFIERLIKKYNFPKERIIVYSKYITHLHHGPIIKEELIELGITHTVQKGQVEKDKNIKDDHELLLNIILGIYQDSIHVRNTQIAND